VLQFLTVNRFREATAAVVNEQKIMHIRVLREHRENEQSILKPGVEVSNQK
jgi:hypothetical protein